MMGLVGLDYNAVLAIAKLLGFTMTPDLFHLVQVLEWDILQEQAKE